jgi:glycosyltransferase involved in cell wall biosynthesis
MTLKISVVIPAYNAGPYLKEAIESALAQTYPPHEVVVIDDGSTDNTADIARSFGWPVRLFQQPNSGLSAARNRGIREATGDWVALLDADDAFLPDKLALQVRAIENDPKVLLVYTGARVLFQDGTYRDYPAMPTSALWPTLRYRTTFHVASALSHRDTLLECGGFDLSLHADQDWELWIRFLRLHTVQAFAAVTEPVTIYRMVSGSLSDNIMAMVAEHQILLDRILLVDLTGIQRLLWRRRILAKFFYDACIVLRAQGNPTHLTVAIQSLRQWPFPGRTVPLLRYKVMAHMLSQALRQRFFLLRTT